MTSAALDDRYGRTASPMKKRLTWGAVGIVAVAFFGYLGWTTVASNMNAVSVDDLGFSVVDAKTTEVRFQFTAPAGRDVVCAIEALDEEFGAVGYSLVTYPAGEQRSQKHTENVRTVAEATTGFVSGCWVA
ncbi:DUF4307 domain-containing protein [Microbacterium sp. YY-03]|uniref:DUF4307 domain-containing protein n=1 Tax=Microbacterium sp. YY-03 TaxID=3421636 RepID=UPI003D16459C